MKTLILNGSPKKNGDTSALIHAFLEELNGEVRIVTLDDDISPCLDCRYCWEHNGCAIQDDMQEIYLYHAECNNVVLASPIWFSSLSGPLLNIASRMQTLFIGRSRRREIQEANKNGVLLLTGAQVQTKDAPERAALMIMQTMLVKHPLVAKVYSLDTDNTPACMDIHALAQAHDAARILNEMGRG